MVPGRLLHRLARSICSATSFERVVEPAIADLQAESQRRLRKYRSQRVAALFIGYLAVWKVTVLCIVMPGRSVEERRALARMLAWTALTTVVAASPMIVIPLTNFPSSAIRRAFLVGLFPQALPLALPVGLTFGVALGLVGAVRSRQTAKDVAILTLVTALLSLLVAGWWMPVANQAFRQSMFEATGGNGVVMKGASEMNFSEVNREAASLEARGGNFREALAHRWSLHTRLALPAAAVTLPAFLFFISSRRMVSRGLLASGACLGYLVLMISSGSLASTSPAIPVAFAAWLPNVVFGGAALLLRRSS